jgi:amidohydrolase
MTTPRSVPNDIIDAVIATRRQMHRFPELSNEEVETTALLRRELTNAGLTDIRPVGRTGVVIDVQGSSPGRTVAVRADIDALPVTEQTQLPFASETRGVMHACGHDVHAATVLAVALAVQRKRDSLPGTLRFIFQPAEEREPLGARAVIAGGFLEGVSAIVALHVSPDFDTGTVALRPGTAMASSDEFEIVVRGRSSHAGWPNVGRDAIATLAAIIQESQKIVSRRMDPRTPLVINFGKIVGGNAANVVADEARAEGTIRTLDEGSRAEAHRLLHEIVGHVSRAHASEGTVEIATGEPVLHNDPVVTEVFGSTARRLLGDSNVRELELPTMNSEDFAFYSHVVPAAMIWQGTRNEEEGFTYPLHHPRFAVDEDVMSIGAEILLATARALLVETDLTPPAQPNSQSSVERSV